MHGVLRRASLATVVLTLLLAATAHAAVDLPAVEDVRREDRRPRRRHRRAAGRQLVRLRDERPRRPRAVDARLRRHAGPDPADGLQHDPAAVLARRRCDSNVDHGVDFSGGKNAALQGRTPLQAMDVVIDRRGAAQGLVVLLDNHSLADDGYSDGALVRPGGYTEDDWVARLAGARAALRGQPNVIGADLKNEPHGEATWGTGGARPTGAPPPSGPATPSSRSTPNWLIVVEGIEGPSPAAARPALVGRQPRGRAPAAGPPRRARTPRLLAARVRPRRVRAALVLDPTTRRTCRAAVATASATSPSTASRRC